MPLRGLEVKNENGKNVPEEKVLQLEVRKIL